MSVSNAVDFFTTHLPERLKTRSELIEKINTIYKFIVTGDSGGTWLVDLTKQGGAVSKEDSAIQSDAKCTITVAEKDFVDLVNGKLNPQMAFMMGKLKIAGDMGLALKLGSILV